MQLAGGAAASVTGLRPRFSGESFFQANLAQGGASVDGPISRSGQSTDPARGHREEALVVSAGVRGTSTPSGRVATITATGLVNNAVVRSGA